MNARPRQVTAPVRETAAQALGMAIQVLDGPSVTAIAAMLRQLQVQQDWRVRYGELGQGARGRRFGAWLQERGWLDARKG